MSYGIIIRETGRFYRTPEIFEDMSVPINELELQYVELTDRLVSSLTTHSEVIDTANTYYSNGEWVESYITPAKVDIKANREADKAAFLAEANRRINIEDISDAYRQQLTDYIAALEAITPTDEEIQAIEWPEKPF